MEHGPARLAGAAVTIATLLLAGCQNPGTPSAGTSVVFELLPKPPRVGLSHIKVELKDAAANPVSGARLSIEGNMSHPGMAPSFGLLAETGPGRYQGDLTLGMPGDWVVQIHGTLPGGGKLEKQIEINNVQPN
jgi:hypothetical protein